MNRRWLCSCVAAAGAVLCAPIWGWAEERGHLTIGLRLSRLELEESRRYLNGHLDNANRRGNFLGSLWGLDPQASWVPAPFLEYRPVASAGVGVAYDEVRIRTLDWAGSDALKTTAGDGDLQLRGARVYLLAAAPGHMRLTPLARVGYGFYSSAFFETGGWAAPGAFFVVEDTRGWFADLTIRVSIGWRLQAEASYESLWLRDVRGQAGPPAGARGVFPARGDVARLGLACRF